MKYKVIFTALTAMLILSLAAACSRTTETDDKGTEPTPTQAAAVTISPDDGEISDMPDAGSDRNEAEPTRAEDSKEEQKADPTPIPAKSEDKAEATPTPEPRPEENGAPEEQDTTSVEEHMEDDTYQKQLEAERQEAWKNSFLVWIPEFEAGVFSGTSAADTFDYSYFTLVGGQNPVRAYISSLTESGFDISIDTGEKDGRLWFYATNADNWTVLVDYEESTDSLRIGSGFYDPETEDNEEQIDRLWSTSLLMYLPLFGDGQLESHYDDDQDGMFSYAIFSGVSDEAARAYVLELQNAGFIYEVEYGDTDGTIWYIAVSEDNLNCDFQYSDNICKLGCGVYND